MARAWFTEMAEKHASLPRPTTTTRSSRFWDNPNQILIRLLALLGILLLIERISTFYVSNITASHSSLSPLQSETLHPLDSALDHRVNNTGHGLHVDGIHGKKAIVVASTTREDTEWVHENFPDWEINTYVVDDRSANLTLFKNRGREAAVYLTYLINHYYHLPDYMVFLHADRYQWHNEDPMYDGVPPVRNLRLSHVKSVGYASLRCTWNPGCPVGQHPDTSGNDSGMGISHTYASQWAEFFPESPVPTEVGAPCCAQFAITRERALERQVWEYEAIRQWLWETSMGAGRSGRVLEYMWHKLFGMDAVSCPSAEQCFCDTFGLCDLKCPRRGGCQGRYKLPPWNKGVPIGWPLYGQGTNGYPKWGWWQKFYPGEEFGLGYAKEDRGPWNGEDAAALSDSEAANDGPDEIDMAATEESLDDVQDVTEDAEENTENMQVVSSEIKDTHKDVKVTNEAVQGTAKNTLAVAEEVKEPTAGTPTDAYASAALQDTKSNAEEARPGEEDSDQATESIPGTPVVTEAELPAPVEPLHKTKVDIDEANHEEEDDSMAPSGTEPGTEAMEELINEVESAEIDDDAENENEDEDEEEEEEDGLMPLS